MAMSNLISNFSKPCTKHQKNVFLLWCVNEHVDFRIPEIHSLVSMLKLNVEWIEMPTLEPFILAKFECEADAKKLLSRSVLIRSVYELWAQGFSQEELVTGLKSLPNTFTAPYSGTDQTFKLMVESFGKKLSYSTKVEKMEQLDFLPFKGQVQLDNPNHVFHLFEFYGMNSNYVNEEPCRRFFGRWICDSRRHTIHEITLKKRKFIGNTSMDPTLSIIMANMAQVQENHLVLDPFVGSGSLLVAAAKFGGKVLGTDLDYLMLLGKAKPTRCNQKERDPDESIRENLRQYRIESQFLDVVVADTALPLWRDNMGLDSIVTDPPYGIREATERIGSKKKYSIPGHLAEKHIPSKVDYNLQDVLVDLLNFSVIQLRLGGKLVYWLPVFREDFNEKEIPSHPCLKLQSYSQQVLSRHASRFLITMEKVKEGNSAVNLTANVSEMTKSFREKYFGGSRTETI